MENTLTIPVVDALRAVDTPTVCNALEILMGRRSSHGFTRQPVLAADPLLPQSLDSPVPQH